jgi:hypothetical protein
VIIISVHIADEPSFLSGDNSESILSQWVIVGVSEVVKHKRDLVAKVGMHFCNEDFVYHLFVLFGDFDMLNANRE